MNKKCPFNQENCSAGCALYVSPEELNESVKNKLASIGIIDKETGICALKNLAMCSNRFVFENSNLNSCR